MEELYAVVQSTPIIDHHAHNLLLSEALDAHDLLAITSEAQGSALQNARSTLSHFRAVKQLSTTLQCEPSWEAVKEAIKAASSKPDDAWARRCFEGIETVLIDDGLDLGEVHPYKWHDRLTKSKCKRILRIERLAEFLISQAIPEYRRSGTEARNLFPSYIQDKFRTAISEALVKPDIVGFKSVICYRTGLNIPTDVHGAENRLFAILNNPSIETYMRLEDPVLSPYFVHLTAQLIASHKNKKPFQFHTGLGDNDINLRLSNPSHLQLFIEKYKGVPIVLLHASYPFTAEAGYLASVYKNVYLDIGEVFPMISQDAQERVISDALAVCPSEKLNWSTDGHWFPETYLLAVIQIREGLFRVLSDYVRREALTVSQAIKVVEDLLFNTSNRIYNLDLELRPLERQLHELSLYDEASSPNALLLEEFSRKSPWIEYIRLQWVDYSSLVRARVVPIKKALQMVKDKKSIGIARAVFGLLHQDLIVPGFTPISIYNLCPQYESLKLGHRKNHATVQCHFQETDGDEVFGCPRTLLKNQVKKGKAHGMSFLIGFEVEIVLMKSEKTPEGFKFGELPFNQGGHAWSTTRALQNDETLDLIEIMLKRFEEAGIELEQYHPESSPGQYEFIFAALPPLDAVDSLIAAREIISSIAANADVRATLYPKPFPMRCGTGAHVHMSIEPAVHWEAFYGGILKHLRGIVAFTYSKAESYDRLADGVWAGGTWIAWGTQNREVPLRRIESSHFEIKCQDGLANPYIAIAAFLGAGIQSVIDNPSSASKPLPPSPHLSEPPSPVASSPEHSPSSTPSTPISSSNNQPPQSGPQISRHLVGNTVTPTAPLISSDCPSDPSLLTPTQRADLGITQQLPRSLPEALEALEEDKWLGDVLGHEFVEMYVRVKRAEEEMLSAMNADERRTWLIERF